MKTTEQNKNCTKCMATVPVEALQCLYCGNDLSKQHSGYSAPDPGYSQQQTLEQSLYTLYKPSYTPREASIIEEEKPLEEKPYTFQKAPLQTPSYPFAEQDIAAQTESNEKGFLPVLPFVLLTAGLNLLLFSLILAIFGKNGKLTLSWDTSYWAFLLLTSLPIIYMGWSKTMASRSKEE